MDRRFKGQKAELLIEVRAAEKGFVVSKPTTPARYDAILDDGCRLYRVQMKYAEASPSAADGAVVVELRRRGEVYSKEEVDLLLVYIAPVNKVVALKSNQFCGKSTLTLRYAATKNSQVAGTVMVDDLLW